MVGRENKKAMATYCYEELGPKNQIYVRKNGQVHYEVAPSGKVTKHDHFPCATPGVDFLKPMYRRTDCGNIGEKGYRHLLELFHKKERLSKRHLRPFQNGWEGFSQFAPKQ